MAETSKVELSLDDIRHVTAFAAAFARQALPIFEVARPDDSRPRSAIDGGEAFAETGKRTSALRQLAWAAHKAAREVPASAAADAALSAMHAAGAAFLHPLYSPLQVKHILGSAVHHMLALGQDGPKTVAQQYQWITPHANTRVRSVLSRFPPPSIGRTEFSKLLATLDTELRREQL